MDWIARPSRSPLVLYAVTLWVMTAVPVNAQSPIEPETPLLELLRIVNQSAPGERPQALQKLAQRFTSMYGGEATLDVWQQARSELRLSGGVVWAAIEAAQNQSETDAREWAEFREAAQEFRRFLARVDGPNSLPFLVRATAASGANHPVYREAVFEVQRFLEPNYSARSETRARMLREMTHSLKGLGHETNPTEAPSFLNLIRIVEQSDHFSSWSDPVTTPEYAESWTEFQRELRNASEGALVRPVANALAQRYSRAAGDHEYLSALIFLANKLPAKKAVDVYFRLPGEVREKIAGILNGDVKYRLSLEVVDRDPNPRARAAAWKAVKYLKPEAQAAAFSRSGIHEVDPLVQHAILTMAERLYATPAAVIQRIAEYATHPVVLQKVLDLSEGKTSISWFTANPWVQNAAQEGLKARLKKEGLDTTEAFRKKYAIPESPVEFDGSLAIENAQETPASMRARVPSIRRAHAKLWEIMVADYLNPQQRVERLIELLPLEEKLRQSGARQGEAVAFLEELAIARRALLPSAATTVGPLDRAKGRVGRELTGMGTFAAAFLLKEGMKALEKRDGQAFREAALQLKTAQFWGSLAAFSAVAGTTEVGLALVRAPGFVRAALPLATGMAVTQLLAKGHVSARDVGISTASFLASGVVMDFVANELRFLLFRSSPPGWMFRVATLAASLYLGEKLETWLHSSFFLARPHALDGVSQKLERFSPREPSSNPE